jgi:hypothetical protein
LTGEAPADDVGNNSVCAEPLGGELADISINRNPGPILAQDALAKVIDLAKRRCPEASPFQTNIEAADASEEGEDVHAF